MRVKVFLMLLAAFPALALVPDVVRGELLTNNVLPSGGYSDGRVSASLAFLTGPDGLPESTSSVRDASATFTESPSGPPAFSAPEPTIIGLIGLGLLWLWGSPKMRTGFAFKVALPVAALLSVGPVDGETLTDTV